MNRSHWQVWIDTGGTFTDCIGVDPSGSRRTVKVLSSSALRGSLLRRTGPRNWKIEEDWSAPDGFVNGMRFRLLGRDGGTGRDERRVDAWSADTSTLTLSEALPGGDAPEGRSFEVISGEEAPVLAARLLTRTPPGSPLPPVRLRLATTKATNALLEGRPVPTALLVTGGYEDLLDIGDQTRPDLFALEISKTGSSAPRPRVIPTGGRMDAEGGVIREPDLDRVRRELSAFLRRNEGASVGISLMHGYRNPEHESLLKELAEEAGARYVSVSSELSPVIKYLPRTQTTRVNALLEPVLREYLDSVRQVIGRGTLHIMSSAGGLSRADTFQPKDSLLSGPAGGVVGAATAGGRHGHSKVISFDMGGTSTDVARYDGAYDYVFRHRVGEHVLNAPALSIETVAAGGGSICHCENNRLRVGPQSAGASPGPACYGAGGPLTVTDVNLLLGRLQPENFSIPIDVEASRRELEEILFRLEGSPAEEEVLEGFLRIANERMADAVRRISLRKGYDPSAYALVAFGGAGGQHACAIARLLEMEHIIVPPEAGLLSAWGLGHAMIEKFAERQVLKPLPEARPELPGMLEALGERALEKVRAESADSKEVQIRRRLLFMRLEGQDSTIEIEWDGTSDPLPLFREAYRRRYGHWVENREAEVESMRAVASTAPPEREAADVPGPRETPAPMDRRTVRFGGEPRRTPLYRREELKPGCRLVGPAVVLDPYSTIVLEPGWEAAVASDGTLRLSLEESSEASGPARRRESVEAVELELFTNRFTSIAGEMGEMLRRTALSVNIKERMDFSCALLSAEGELVVNAPHIPVHLGALGLCLRRLKKSIEMEEGDVIVTNHPAYGGSHLPDITVVTPVFGDEGRLLGYAANRAHHAEIGGSRPGSMPPEAGSLAEEGVVIPPTYLVRGGEPRWEEMRRILRSGRWPSRAVEENMADLQAAVAANRRGERSLAGLAAREGAGRVLHYMEALRERAARKMRSALGTVGEMDEEVAEQLDDGTPLRARVTKQGERLTIDFTGTGGVHPGNLNATPAIVQSVVMYVLRVLVGEEMPLNEGLLDPVRLKLPRCLLNPEFPEDPAGCPAVVGGNTEVSQRLVDLLLKPFGRVACSQGTMNNILFGNERFGYYETVGGGTGAGPGFNGAHAVHHHMTNTGATDPEILEHRYPVRLDRYAIRTGSGGAGRWRGGDGIARELTFLEPVSLSVLTQHRAVAPYGLSGGEPGERGSQKVIRKGGGEEELRSVDGAELAAGDRLLLLTPGGGGFGKI